MLMRCPKGNGTNTNFRTGLFEPSHMRYSIKRGEDGAGEPTFADMVEKAIRIMSRRSEGYFLLAEGRLGRMKVKHFVLRRRILLR